MFSVGHYDVTSILILHKGVNFCTANKHV